jgi:hypothetical protein
MALSGSTPAFTSSLDTASPARIRTAPAMARPAATPPVNAPATAPATVMSPATSFFTQRGARPSRPFARRCARSVASRASRWRSSALSALASPASADCVPRSTPSVRSCCCANKIEPKLSRMALSVFTAAATSTVRAGPGEGRERGWRRHDQPLRRRGSTGVLVRVTARPESPLRGDGRRRGGRHGGGRVNGRAHLAISRA